MKKLLFLIFIISIFLFGCKTASKTQYKFAPKDYDRWTGAEKYDNIW